MLKAWARQKAMGVVSTGRTETTVRGRKHKERVVVCCKTVCRIGMHVQGAQGSEPVRVKRIVGSMGAAAAQPQGREWCRSHRPTAPVSGG